MSSNCFYLEEDITSETFLKAMTKVDEFEGRCDAVRFYKRFHILKEPYKEVFFLRIFCNMDFKQIAAIFEKTSDCACVTYYRAMCQKQVSKWNSMMDRRRLILEKMLPE